MSNSPGQPAPQAQYICLCTPPGKGKGGGVMTGPCCCGLPRHLNAIPERRHSIDEYAHLECGESASASSTAVTLGGVDFPLGPLLLPSCRCSSCICWSRSASSLSRFRIRTWMAFRSTTACLQAATHFEILQYFRARFGSGLVALSNLIVPCPGVAFAPVVQFTPFLFEQRLPGLDGLLIDGDGSHGM